MSGFIIRRIIQAIIVIIIASIIVFLLLRVLPGDPLLLYMAQNQLDALTLQQIQDLRIQFGLDHSLPVQYLNWFNGLLHGDLGTSLFHNIPVIDLIRERLPITVILGLMALILSSCLGILAGLICAMKRGYWQDTLVTTLANFGISMPNFWLGVLLVLAFSVQLGWLPVQGYTSPFDNFWLSTRKMIMPVLCLMMGPLASNTRQTRSSMLEIIRQDYVRTAWSKGLEERTIVIRHIMKNGLIPVLTMIGIQISYIIGGSVLIETVFNIPGMGRMMVEAVFSQDFLIVQAGCLVIATMVTMTNLIVDISYGWLDPRIRFG